LLVGSGITFITRDKTSHQVRRMAMDPKYAGVVVKRWQDFRGASVHGGDQTKFDDMHPALSGVEVTGAPLGLAVLFHPNHPYTLSASLAVRLYCRRFAFAFTNDVKMELAWSTVVCRRPYLAAEPLSTRSIASHFL